MNRRFGETFKVIDDDTPECSFDAVESDVAVGLCRFVRDQLQRASPTFNGPFGRRRVFYCDFTASGRSLPCIEDHVTDEVLPFYANTHSSTAVCAEQSTLFLHEARSIIRNAVHASEHDVVLFCGAGCTSAVHTLIHALHLDKPPVLFVGPHEHHANLLPWRRLAQKIVAINETEAGVIDCEHLDEQLKLHRSSGVQLIGCFSAASNVTGVVADVHRITTILHRHDALAFWDYACAALYVRIEMNPADAPVAAKDAVFFSGHKFLGGVGSPGVLVAKKSLFRNRTPLRVGGGAVFWVDPESETYLRDVEYREEAGTPDVLGVVRLALAVRLKNAVGVENIARRDRYLLRRFFDGLSCASSVARDRLSILGPSIDSVHRLPIISFVIRAPCGLYLHHAFVTVLLNDLFGLQTRNGCMCAGPYAQRLLGIDLDLARRYEQLLQEHSGLDRVHLRRVREYSDYEMLRPGFTRLNLPYFFSDADVDFVLDAVLFVAEHAWRFLPMYVLNPESGEWHHRDARVFRDRKWLSNVRFTVDGIRLMSETNDTDNNSFVVDTNGCLQTANDLMTHCAKFARRNECADAGLLHDDHVRQLRWFVLSSEARESLLNPQSLGQNTKTPPFVPRIYEKLDKITDPLDQSNFVDDEIPLKLDNFKKSTDPKLEIRENGDSKIERLSDDDPQNNAPSSCSTCKTRPSTSYELDLRQNWQDRTLVRRDDTIREGEQKARWMPPPKSLLKPTLQAIDDFSMLRRDDRVLVCLSGGKDSLALLHTMHQVQRHFDADDRPFSLGAITIDPLSEAYDPSPLIEYARALNIDYFYERQDIVGKAASLGDRCRSICAFCSRMKRGRLYAAARMFQWNVLAFGQHLDDLAERENDLRIIRPFVYVREKQLRDFSESRRLPIIPENCPACFQVPKERHRVKQFLAAQELQYDRLFASLRQAMRPLMQTNDDAEDESSQEHDV